MEWIILSTLLIIRDMIAASGFHWSRAGQTLAWRPNVALGSSGWHLRLIRIMWHFSQAHFCGNLGTMLAGHDWLECHLILIWEQGKKNQKYWLYWGSHSWCTEVNILCTTSFEGKKLDELRIHSRTMWGYRILWIMKFQRGGMWQSNCFPAGYAWKSGAPQKPPRWDWKAFLVNGSKLELSFNHVWEAFWGVEKLCTCAPLCALAHLKGLIRNHF